MKHTRFTIDDILSPQFGQQQRHGRRHCYVHGITSKHKKESSFSKSTETNLHNVALFYKTLEATGLRGWTDALTNGQTTSTNLRNYQVSAYTTEEYVGSPKEERCESDRRLFERTSGCNTYGEDDCSDKKPTKRFYSKTENFNSCSEKIESDTEIFHSQTERTQSQIHSPNEINSKIEIHPKTAEIHPKTEEFHSKSEKYKLKNKRFHQKLENESPIKEKVRVISGPGIEETVDKEGAESPREEKPALWPAWVYCTRYSDRPSAGPRVRKIQKKEKVSDEKRPRTAFTSDQLEKLKTVFETSHYLTETRRRRLATDLGLNEAQIKIWFQNKRAKLKKTTLDSQPLAEQLMAQGLYNHKTVKRDEVAYPRS